MSSSQFESLAEAAARTGYSRQRLWQLATGGKIEGAIRVGAYWALPADWQPPPRQRRKKREGEK